MTAPVHAQEAELCGWIAVVAQRIDDLDGGGTIVTDQHHVAPRLQCRPGTLRVAPTGLGGGHVEVVAEDHALESQAPPQHVPKPHG